MRQGKADRIKSMRPLRAMVLVAFSLCAAGAGSTHAQTVGNGDPYAGLKTYDFVNRAPVFVIRQMIQKDLGDKDQLAQIEQGLIGVLKDPGATFAGKQEACRMLYEIGTSRSVPALARLLTDEKLSDDARYGLERNRDDAVGRAFRDALSTATGKPLIGIINSLGDRRDPDAVADLATLAVNSDTLVADAALTALGKIATPDAVTVLQPLVKDNPVAARAMLTAAGGLAESGKKRDAERIFVDLSSNGTPETRLAALNGLISIRSSKAGAIAFGDLKSPDNELQVGASAAFAMVTDPQALQDAAALWTSLPTPAQIALLNALAARGESPAGGLSTIALTSPDPALRMTAIRVFARMEGSASVPKIADIATHGEGRERSVAREELVSMPGEEADKAILEAQQKGEPAVRVALVGVLADRGTPDDRAALRAAAVGPDEKVATAAARAIGQTGVADDLPRIVNVLVTTSSDAVRDASVDATIAIAQRVGGDRDQSATPLIAALPNASLPARIGLVSALAQIGGPHAIAEVTRAAASTDADIKAAAVTALSENATDPQALPALWNIAKTDGDKAFRVQALRGYIRLLADDNQITVDERVGKLKDAMRAAERPEEKRQALSVLRDCRVAAAMDVAAAGLDEPDIFNESAYTVLYLAADQKKGSVNERAVKGPATDAALDKVILLAKDDTVKSQAQKLR